MSDLCELVQRSLGLSVGRVIGSGVRGAFWSQKAVQRGLQLHVPLGQCEAQADSRIMENYPEYSHVNTLLSCFPFCPERCDFGGGPPVWAEVHGLIRWPLPSSLAPGFSLPCVTAIPTPTMLGNLPTRLMATETKLGTKKPKQTNQRNKKSQEKQSNSSTIAMHGLGKFVLWRESEVLLIFFNPMVVQTD